MLPVSGPFTRTIGDGLGVYYREQRWFRQSRPFNLQLPYSVVDARTSTDSGPSLAPNQMGFVHQDSEAYLNAQEKATQRFYSKISSEAGLGIDLTQFRQAQGMISSRLLQLSELVKYVRKGAFHAFADAVGYVVKEFDRGKKVTFRKKKAAYYSTRYYDFDNGRGKRISARRRALPGVEGPGEITISLRKSKSWAALFLEMHFGWVPLVADVNSCAEVLSDPFPQGKVTGRCSQDYTIQSWDGNIFNFKHTYSGVERCRVSADVFIENPNLALANNLGLVNFASIVWDAMPWSFMLDWIGNMGKFLNSFSQGLGYRIINVCTTHCNHCTSYLREALAFGWVSRGAYFTEDRGNSIPSMKLRFTIPGGLSVTRGLASLALLIQRVK